MASDSEDEVAHCWYKYLIVVRVLAQNQLRQITREGVF